MLNILSRQIYVGLLPIWLGGATLASAESPGDGPIDSPEIEFAAAKTALENLRKKVTSALNVTNQHLITPVNQIADEALEASIEQFNRGQYLSAIRLASVYLDRVQQQDTRNFLDATFVLGHSYDSLGMSGQAMKTWLRYLAAFVAKPQEDSWEELLDVLTSLTATSGQLTAVERAEAMTLVSSVASLELPKDLRPYFVFAASRAARDNGRADLGTLWTAQSIEQKNVNGAIGARILYLSGVMNLAAKQIDVAEDHLTQAMSTATSIDQNIRMLAVLSLARLEAARANYPKALSYYSLVPENSSAHRRALFEKTFLLLKTGQNELALKTGETFVDKYHEGADRLQISTLLAYLQLRAGKHDAASTTLAKNDEELKGILGSLRHNVRGRLRLSHGALLHIRNSASGVLKQSPIIEDGIQQFERLAELSRRTSDLNGEVRNLAFVIGRLELAELNPTWKDRIAQLDSLSRELLTIGHRMIAAERPLMDKHLSPAQRYQLDASAERRVRLLEPFSVASRDSTSWSTYSNIATVQVNLSRVYSRVLKARAQLAAAHFATRRREQRATPELSALNPDQTLERIETLRSRLGVSLYRLRQEAIVSLSDRGPHQSMRRLFMRYSNGLHQEEAILGSTRAKKQTGYEGLLSEDAAHIWALWRVNAKTIFSRIQDLNSEIQTSLMRKSRLLDRALTSTQQIDSDIENATKRLELSLGQAVSSITSHYESEITSRASKNAKWRADLDLEKFDKITKELREDAEQQDLQQQQFREGLQDRRQGVLPQ